MFFPAASIGLQQDIDSLFDSYPKTEVLLLGTFHFKDAGLDSYKPRHDVDIMSEKRQEELALLLDRLKKFAPEAIGLEFNPEEEKGYLEKYEQYLSGRFELPANEIYQIGFKLANMLQHSRVFGVDAEGRHYAEILDSFEDYDSVEKKYIEKLREYAPATRQWYPTYQKLYRYQDLLKTETTLIDFLIYLNSPETIQRSHGIYLVDSFKFGMGLEKDYFGPDMKAAWYNRNLRILQNIYRMIGETEAKRVLVVIGSGHLPILVHAVKSSPELSLVDTKRILEHR
jgi:hypothetical protein